MDIVLIPGLWLNASTWDAVVPRLEEAGHRAFPLTLPGMAGKDADRTGTSLQDHVDAVVAAIDATAGEILLVGHSAGCGIAHAALDARVERVAHVVHVGGFPSADGDVLVSGFEVVGGEVLMPDWAEIGERDSIRDFDEAGLARLYAEAIPVPERVLRDPVRLTDPRRLDVPATMLCPEYTAADLRGWVESEDGPAELAALKRVEYVDLGGGHWPQLTQPDNLARAILACVGY